MGVFLAPVAPVLLGRPVGMWEDDLDTATELCLPWRDVSNLEAHWRASGAVYDMGLPPLDDEALAFFRALPKDDRREVASGRSPAHLDAALIATYHAAHYARISAHRDRPGIPSFKLAHNGDPWHITVGECRSALEIGLPAEPIPGCEHRFQAVQELFDEAVLPLLQLGIEQAGVMVCSAQAAATCARRVIACATCSASRAIPARRPEPHVHSHGRPST